MLHDVSIDTGTLVLEKGRCMGSLGSLALVLFNIDCIARPVLQCRSQLPLRYTPVVPFHRKTRRGAVDQNDVEI